LIPVSTATTTDPLKDSEKIKSLQNKIHIVKPKETLYSIARDYNINVSELKKLNAEAVEKGLKIGQTVKISDTQAAEIPTKSAAIIDVKTVNPAEKVKENKLVSKEKNANVIFHIVEPKETKFGIAKKYGITVQELEQLNPQVVSNLPVGTKLIISGATALSDSSKAVSVNPIVEKPKPVVTEIVQDEIIETKRLMKMLEEHTLEYTKMDRDLLEEIFEKKKDYYINPTKALKLGIIDEIIK
jgi:LysM repeat protein